MEGLDDDDAQIFLYCVVLLSPCRQILGYYLDRPQFLSKPFPVYHLEGLLPLTPYFFYLGN